MKQDHNVSSFQAESELWGKQKLVYMSKIKKWCFSRTQKGLLDKIGVFIFMHKASVVKDNLYDRIWAKHTSTGKPTHQRRALLIRGKHRL